MSSSACCMNRHPPSPDGFAPRPTVASPPHFTLSRKPQDFIPASWSSGSRLSKPEDAEAIQAIFEEDKSDPESEHNKVISKKASSTLSAVKNRLKKHLSKESGISTSKRHSRSSVGTTEEEIERRAELRRIRHKRIQEELSSEGIYDDDAESLSTVDAPSASALLKRASWTHGDPLLFPALALPSLVPIDSPSTASNIPPAVLFNRYVYLHRLYLIIHYNNILQKGTDARSTLLRFDVPTANNIDTTRRGVFCRMQYYYGQFQHHPLATTQFTSSVFTRIRHSGAKYIPPDQKTQLTLSIIKSPGPPTTTFAEYC